MYLVNTKLAQCLHPHLRYTYSRYKWFVSTDFLRTKDRFIVENHEH